MHSTRARYGLIVLGSRLALCVVFGASVFVRRASDRSDRLIPFRWYSFISGAHGAVGTLQSISGESLTLKLRDVSTQRVLVDSQARIEQRRQRVTFGELQVGDRVKVIGSPDNQGTINALWMRILNQDAPRTHAGSAARALRLSS